MPDISLEAEFDAVIRVEFPEALIKEGRELPDTTPPLPVVDEREDDTQIMFVG